MAVRTGKSTIYDSSDCNWEMVLKHWNLLWLVGMRMGFGGHRLEEVVHDAGIHAMLQAAKVWDPNRGRFSTLAWTVVYRAYIDWKRKRKRIRETPSETLTTWQKEIIIDDRDYLPAENELLPLIRRLPLEEKVIVHLYFWHDMSFRKIAKNLGWCSRERAHKLFVDALERLRPMVEEAEPLLD